jgi:hypothetical protein
MSFGGDIHILKLCSVKLNAQFTCLEVVLKRNLFRKQCKRKANDNSRTKQDYGARG